VKIEQLGYVPSPWGAIYHNLWHNEVLGAGAAGPGKTTVLLHEPDAQIHTEHERCVNREHPFRHDRMGDSVGWALHLRRTTKMLEQTIQKFLRLYPRIDPGMKWDVQKTTATFSSGYRYQFGHCKDPYDYENYMSFEFCVAKGTMIRMGDGATRPIESILPGDTVLTLEGPRRVLRAEPTGTKPCVETVVRGPFGFVGRQLHSTTHPVLVDTNPESPASQFDGTRRSGGRSRTLAHGWQDFESLVGGAPASQVRRVSRVAQEICSEACCDSRREALRRRSWTSPVVLHERTVLSARSRTASATECRTGPGDLRSSEGSPPRATAASRRVTLMSFSSSTRRAANRGSQPTFALWW
jgi:hypothetical protein